jgi:hypothetical protein
MVDNAINVVNAEHRRFVNRDNISSSIFMSKLPDVLASGELEELGDMSPKELVASIKLQPSQAVPENRDPRAWKR